MCCILQSSQFYQKQDFAKQDGNIVGGNKKTVMTLISDFV